MATFNSSHLKLISIIFIILSIFTSKAISQSDECKTETNNSCNDKKRALTLKIIAIVSILVTSMIGVGAPLFTHSIPALNPEKDLFVIVKTFAAGIILATGFMHVLPDSFDMLSSSCLKENPWHKFPFTGFLAMLSAIGTLMVDSMATSIYSNRCNSVGVDPAAESEVVHRDREMGVVESTGHFHGHFHESKAASGGQQLLRYRVIAMVIRFSKTSFFNYTFFLIIDFSLMFM